MKILLLLSDEPKQRYVIRELAKNNQICCVIFENRYTPLYRLFSFLRSNSYNIVKISRGIFSKIKIKKYEKRDNRIIRDYFYEGGSAIPIDKNIPVHHVRGVNQQKTINLVLKYNPDLLIVFGTSLLKNNFLNQINKTIINVHTGLAPYYRGGQAAFWALYNNEPEYIGVTIHYISKGIDSGDIVLQDRPVIEDNDNLCSIECKLAVLAARMLNRAMKFIENGSAKRVIQANRGKLFLSKMYSLEKRIELEKKIEDGLIKRYLKEKKINFEKVKIVNESYIEKTI